MEIAVVGTGNVAQHNYLPCLSRHEDVTLTCYSRRPDAASEVASRFGARAARSLEELFDRDIDAVLVLTREMQRLEATRALLPFRPKRLFFEKPLVAKEGQERVSEQDFLDGKELLRQAKETGSETAMVFNYRFFDQTLRARRLIEERGFGRPVSITALVHYACWSHCIDLMLHLGGPVAELAAEGGRTEHRFGDAMKAADVGAVFRTEEDAVGTILGTCATAFQFPLFEMIFAYERGRISFRGLDEPMEVLDSERSEHELYSFSRETSRRDKYNQSFEKSIDAYLKSIREGGPPPVPGIAGLEELQFEAALRKSVAERRPVVLADDFPIDL